MPLSSTTMRVSGVVMVALAACPLAGASNLVFNGDFEQGNIGFTTEYANAGSNSDEGQYNIRSAPNTWNGAFAPISDHTPAPGTLMMVINGATSRPLEIWRQTVPVRPGTTYAFSGWVATLVNGSSAVLRVTINDDVVVAGFAAPTSGSAWTPFSGSWSGGALTATISITNLNTSEFPNDFALDDLALVAVSALCPADLTGDGFVDDSDFVIFAAAYDAFTIPPANSAADLTGDGFVDDSDFVIFAAAYEQFTCD